MIELRLTSAQAERLHDILAAVLTRVDDDHAEAVRRKLYRAAPNILCRHCRARPHRRRSGLCDACHAYQARYGHLPRAEVVLSR